MAGEWIPMRLDLGTDPAVVSVALALDMDEYAVVGRLHKLWVWANQHTLNGHAKGVTANWLDRFLSAPGFTSALENAGWLKVENDGVRVPKFESWNSQGAKRRLDAAKRQQKARTARHTSVTKMSQDSVTSVTKKCDKSVTRVEESREEERREERIQLKTEDSSTTATPPHEPTAAGTLPKDAPRSPETACVLSLLGDQPAIAEILPAPKEAAPESKLGAKSIKHRPVDDSPTILTFPCSGTTPTWTLTQKQIDDWAELYPSLDILAECRKALAWVAAKGHKTAKGMPAFLVNWLNRSTDRPKQQTFIGANTPQAKQEYIQTQFTGLS